MKPRKKAPARKYFSPESREALLADLKSAIEKETAFLSEAFGGKKKEIIKAASRDAAERIEELREMWNEEGVNCHIECMAALKVAWILCEALHKDIAGDERKAEGLIDAGVTKKKTRSLFRD